MKLKMRIWLCLLVLLSFSQDIHAQKTIKLEDWVYEETIKTPLFYVNSGAFDEQFSLPVVPLLQSDPLKLEFDELGGTTRRYYYKIIHCQADWTQSNLLESEFLQEFINDYLITDYALSFNTKVKYVHYAFNLPKLKISGNYVVQVYRNGNPDDVIITRRFMVYDNKIEIMPALKISQGIEERFTHQQIDFSINYSAYAYIFNPLQDVKVVIRQNGRWDNALFSLKPLYVNIDDKILNYNFFNLENNFPGGNEFRMFDCRKTRTTALNVQSTEILPDGINLNIMTDKTRNGKTYIFLYDANGRYVVANDEAGGNLGDPDYVNVNFEFKTNEMPFGNIYVLGGFNDFKIDDKFKLQYDSNTETYRCKVLLKQGYYNYIYAIKGIRDVKADEIELEGSFFQTENMYEIFVYNRPIGGRSDLIIGYYSVKFNGQQ